MWRDDLAAAVGFVTRLPGFLRRPIGEAEASATLTARLAARERDFLEHAGKLIFAVPDSPYRALLRHAGCEPGDLERLVRAEGLDGALRALAARGVYLTGPEFKGRIPVVRGSAVIEAGPERLRNPRIARHLSSQTSGSGGSRTAVAIDLAYVRDCAIDSLLMLRARGGSDWIKGHWAPLGGGAMMSILQSGAFGDPPARWFSHVDPGDGALHPRYRWAASSMATVSRLAGRPLPWPEHVPPDAPLPVANWMQDTLRAGRTPHLLTYPSSAARLGEHARAHGIDLTGAQVMIGGEPITARRLATSRAAGAVVVPRYGAAETGPIGFGCLAPQADDEVHVLSDLHALVRLEMPPHPALPASALYLSSLRPTTSLVLLNVCLGDEGVLERRDCGCPLAALGWTAHLHSIRSFEKLTAGGTTLLDVDIARILDDVLPARFGGHGADYQIVEDEDADGVPRLRLLVHPDLGPLDAAAVNAALLAAIEAHSPLGRVTAAVWRRQRTVEVVRERPRTTASGKILHLLRRPPAT